MNLPNKISSIFHVHPGEGRLVTWLLIHSFFLGVTHIFARTSAFTLFLVEFDAQTLPYVYIGAAIADVLIGFIYLKLGESLSLSKLLAINLSFQLAGFVLLWLGLSLTGSKWLVLALPIWFDIMWVLSGLAFWSLAGSLLNVRQGKRLFGLIWAGTWVAVVSGGFLVPSLVELIGTPNLLLLAAAGLAGALGSLGYIMGRYGNPASDNGVDTVTKDRLAEDKKPITQLLRNRYVILICALIIFWWMAFYFIDNIFYDRAALQYPTEKQLAAFLGPFFAIAGLVTLFSTTFLAGPLLNRYGLKVSLLITPVILLAGTILTAVTGTIATGTLLVLFWLTTLTKLFDIGLGYSLDKSAQVILYQPLPTDHRVQTLTVVDGIVFPVSAGLAGIILLIFHTLLTLTIIQIVYALLFVLAAWVAVVILLGREYPVVLMQALFKRQLSGAGGLHLDKSSAAVLQKALQSPHPNVVIYALNTLEESEPEAVIGYLPELITHPAPEVRQESLQRIERLRLEDALDAVRRAAETETNPSVKAAALRTLATLCDIEASEQVYPHLENPDPQVRRGAIVGLLQNSGVEITVRAEDTLHQMAMSQEPADRMVAAQVIGDVAARNLRRLLEQLLQDEELQVRRAALIAAGQAKYPDLWSLVVAGVSVPYIRSTAAAALVAGGEAAATEVQAAFSRPDQDRQMLVRLARVCGRIGGDQMVAFLKENLDFPDNEVRTHILAALSQCGYQATDIEHPMIQQQIKTEITQAASTLSTLVDIHGNPNASSHQPTFGKIDHSTPEADHTHQAVSLMATVLKNQLAQIRTRIFFLLSFIYDAGTILQAQVTLEDSRASPEKQAYALEVLDLQLSREIKTHLFPLLKRDLNPQQCLKALSTAFPQPSLDRSQRLHQIITGPTHEANPWAKACALHTTATLKLNDDNLVRGTVSTLHSHANDALVAEMAILSLARLDESLASDHLRPLNDPVKSQIANVTNQLELAKSKNEPLLSTVDKVMLLKKVDMFAQTTDEVLVNLAALLEEVNFKSGETVIEKGDHGDCMYFIVEGKVRIHDESQIINYLPAGDAFGEMALLEPEPRTVSVTADEDTLLLRLDQEPFHEIIEDHIELVRGIIHVLTRRLRNSVRDLTELNKLLKEKAIW